MVSPEPQRDHPARRQRILVTGGCGFIGSAIVDELVDLGHEVVVLDSLAPDVHPRRPDYLNGMANYIYRDVVDSDAWLAALDGVDGVCHQAARVGLGLDFGDVERYVADNDCGTAAGLWAMHHVGFTGRIVLASSMVVYGEGRYVCPEHLVVPPGTRAVDALEAGRFEPPCPVCGRDLGWAPVDEDAPLAPQNVYAATKLHQEHLCAAFGREHGNPVTSLRYHNVYGPRMPRYTPYAGVASIFRSALERGVAPRVFEDGGQMRDFVHVHDVARANVAALTNDIPFHGALNISSGHPHSVLDLADALCAAIGVGSGGSAAGADIEPEIVGGYRLGDVRHVVASPLRAREAIGFSATIGFAEGMAEFADAPLR